MYLPVARYVPVAGVHDNGALGLLQRLEGRTIPNVLKSNRSKRKWRYRRLKLIRRMKVSASRKEMPDKDKEKKR